MSASLTSSSSLRLAARSSIRTLRHAPSSSRTLSTTARRSASLQRGTTFITASTHRSASRTLIQGSAPKLSRSMFIQTESTPNDDSLKFIPGVPVMGSSSDADSSSSLTAEFLDARSAMASPLALRLMGVDGVRAVFYGPDFVTVSKDSDLPWSTLKPEIYSLLMEHFSLPAPLFRSQEDRDAAGPQDTRVQEGDSEVIMMVKELLETRVRPAIMEDGGDIEYRGMDDDGVVRLKLKGSCRGCSSSAVTLKTGIERMLMHYVPEVKGVEQVLDVEEQVANEEFNKLEQRLSSGGKENNRMAQYMSV